LISTNGHVQCLRPENTDLPTFNVQPDTPTPVEEEKQEEPPAGTPFDTGKNPFGAMGDDPFGGGGDAMDDPFGGGDDAMDDPFGGDNPFGS
jgi:hypothetical protein